MTCFLDALEKKIVVYKDVGHEVGRAKNAKMLKYILETHKLTEETFYYGSTMDFADEEGFAHHDDAKILAQEGFKLMEMTKAY